MATASSRCMAFNLNDDLGVVAGKLVSMSLLWKRTKPKKGSAEPKYTKVS